MIEFDQENQRLVLKLVYYGPALSGKTTNLLNLHEQLNLRGRGDLMILDTTEDRTIFFDLLPFFYVSPSGFKIKLKVYTVPGQVRHDATRKALLQRADGVVFVADSRRGMSDVNAESFENLERNLALVGINIDALPLAIQFNKRDLDDIVSESEIASSWGGSGLPVILASALLGDGVIETFRTAVGALFDSVDQKLELSRRYLVDRNDFLKKVVTVGPPFAGWSGA